MAFRIGQRVTVTTPDFREAVRFYRHAFDFDPVQTEAGTDLAAGSLVISIHGGQRASTRLELRTDNLNHARAALRLAGFEEFRWGSYDGDRIAVDPFGFVWSIVVDESLLMSPDLVADDHNFIRPKFGLHCPQAHEVAQFYSDLLEAPVSRLSDGTIILDSGAIRLRFLTSHLSFVCLWLSADAPTADLADDGYDFDGDLARDPFGVYWRVDQTPAADRAVVHDRPGT